VKIRSHPRAGFTLLEVLLASLIAILLLAALYLAMDMTLRQTQQSHENMDVENLWTGVFNRIVQDFSQSLAPLPPKSGGNSSASASSSASTSSSSTTATATTTTTNDPTAVVPTGQGTVAPAPSTTTTTTATATASTDPSSSDPSTATATPSAADIGLQSGILGTDKQLTVFMSRLPGTMTSALGLATPSNGNQLPSDLVRVTYWISSSGTGLCRQERPWVTALGIQDNTDPDLSNESGDLLVPEVEDVTFEYFDGQSWQSQWNPDGTTMSPDGVTPIGPPRAVRVTLNFSFPSMNKGGTPYTPTVVQVIPIRAAPGIYTPPMITASTDPGTTTADTSGTTSSTTASSGTTSGGAGAASGGAGAAAGASSAGKSAGNSTSSTPSSSGAKSSGSAMPSTSMPSTSTPSMSLPSAPATATGTRGGP
jgi:Tfp pilus assembly protein PilV